MSLWYIRIFFAVLCTVAGYYIGNMLKPFVPYHSEIFGVALGFGAALAIIFLELVLRRASIRNLSAAVFGLIFGFFMAWLLTNVLKLIPMDPNIFTSLQIVLVLVFCYLGMVIAMRGKDEFNLIVPYVKFVRQDKRDEIFILDTSVIIDGRIADICQTKFMEGRFVVPRFVLKELQQIADSQDSLKRNRGRRGLDILHKIQKDTHIEVIIHEEDFPDISDVDAKLVKLAKFLSAKVITNDFNLNKIASLQEVQVLNLNDLAGALKPVVLPGEELQVRITKEGKEYNQGVAYLDDGTMVVVDNTRHLIGQTVKVLITSVLQTSAGRMIFAKSEEPQRRPPQKHKR